MLPSMFIPSVSKFRACASQIWSVDTGIYGDTPSASDSSFQVVKEFSPTHYFKQHKDHERCGRSRPGDPNSSSSALSVPVPIMTTYPCPIAYRQGYIGKDKQGAPWQWGLSNDKMSATSCDAGGAN